jgi:nucleoid DNA-binding protein
MLKDKKRNITKKDIIIKISNKIGLSKSYINVLLDDFFVILKQNIKSNNLNIKNFGKFRILNKKERFGRNPKNKVIYKISARKSLVFNASKKLITKIND